MATAFKAKGTNDIGTSPVSVYTVPAATTTVVQSWILCNTHSAEILVTASFTDVSEGDECVLVNGAPVPPGGSLVLFDNNKQNMETGDILKVQSDVASSLDSTLSYMEIT